MSMGTSVSFEDLQGRDFIKWLHKPDMILSFTAHRHGYCGDGSYPVRAIYSLCVSPEYGPRDWLCTGNHFQNISEDPSELDRLLAALVASLKELGFETVVEDEGWPFGF